LRFRIAGADGNAVVQVLYPSCDELESCQYPLVKEGWIYLHLGERSTL
jgi:hypothetical protein